MFKEDNSFSRVTFVTETEKIPKMVILVLEICLLSMSVHVVSMTMWSMLSTHGYFFVLNSNFFETSLFASSEVSDRI